MANAQALVSGSWRISSTSGLFTQTFSNTTTVSAFLAHDVVIPANLSNYALSIAQFSNINTFALQANNQVRVNFGGLIGGSHASEASAGFLVTQLLWTTGGTSGPSVIRIANSGSDSATVRMIFCTS